MATAVLVLLLSVVGLLSAAEIPAVQRKALVLGRGDPYREPDGSQTHPQGAKQNFLRFAGNPQNDPAKGWTCDLSWDVMQRIGMNPTNGSPAELFAYIGKHNLGYRIVIQNGPGGADIWFWGAAVDNGMMPFAPHGNNAWDYHIPDSTGIKSCVSVGGGFTTRRTSYGPGLELFDAVPDHSGVGEDAAQSWANQSLAAKFAKILDAHPAYNIWDARQHLRQAASFWGNGWTEQNGYGRVNISNAVGRLLPAPPVEFRTRLSHDARQVAFTWRNFRMSDFAATVIARNDGRIIYDGAGTNFTWVADHDGEETFTYWSRNQSGECSRMETYQTRVVTGLRTNGIPAMLVLGAARGQEAYSILMCNLAQSNAPGWHCDLFYQRGNPVFDSISSFPLGPALGLLPDWGAMVDYAISNRYRIVLAPVTEAELELSRHAPLWEHATAAGVAVVIPHYASDATYPVTYERIVPPQRLGAAITVGCGTVTNQHSYGPGLEFFDSGPAVVRVGYGTLSQNDSAAVLAAKLARVLEANPGCNVWDARQHLRQSASLYAAGWREDGGYGRPPAGLAKIAKLDLAPPLEIHAQKSTDGKSVAFSWLNFRQSDFAATVITKAGGGKIYEGTGTNFVWRSDAAGEAAFQFFTRGKSGQLSRDEAYTTVRVEGLLPGD